MREINVTKISELIASLCVKANLFLPNDLKEQIISVYNSERDKLCKAVLCDIKENIKVAEGTGLPICQDTGMAIVFLQIGQEVHFVGGDLTDAVNQGVRLGYEKGLLRKSVVGDPLRRINTGDNTPAILYTEIIPGDKVYIKVAPKGFGSENMSAIKMLNPSDGRKGVIEAVLDVVKTAGANPCPPITVGVGIGGDFEQAAFLAKKALCRNGKNSDPYYMELEEELLSKINELGIGPQGFGGDTTALFVHIEYAPTHIAGLPVAVNIGCHVTRHAEAEV